MGKLLEGHQAVRRDLLEGCADGVVSRCRQRERTGVSMGERGVCIEIVNDLYLVDRQHRGTKA
jgi:hypothetical protein